MANHDAAYWAADRAAFEAAMDGEDLDFTPWGLPGIENSYKADTTRLMYHAWAEGREYQRAAAGVPGTREQQQVGEFIAHYLDGKVIGTDVHWQREWLESRFKDGGRDGTERVVLFAAASTPAALNGPDNE